MMNEQCQTSNENNGLIEWSTISTTNFYLIYLKKNPILMVHCDSSL